MESRTNVGERRSAEAGFSLLEALVSATILMTMVFVVSTLSMSGTNAQKYSERVGRVTEISQDLVDEIRGHLQSSVRLFHDDAIGAAYRNLLALPAAPVPLNSSLPRLEAAAIFERDPAVGGKTGNQLLFAKHAWTTEFECASSNRHRIDVYRVVCYYLAIEDAGPQPNSAVGLNLCRFVSEPLADGKQIDRIPDPADQIEVLEHLRDGTPGADGRTFPPVAVVWRLGDAPATRSLEELGLALEVEALRFLSERSDADTTPDALRGVLLLHTGEAASMPAAIAEAARGVRDVAQLRERIVEENRYALEDVTPSARVRAFDWLTARKLAPADFDPLAPARERRAALMRAQPEGSR